MEIYFVQYYEEHMAWSCRQKAFAQHDTSVSHVRTIDGCELASHIFAILSVLHSEALCAVVRRSSG